MSKSARTSHLHAGKPGKRATAPAAAPDASTQPPGHPWVIGGIDYGPAVAAVHDLAAWAFDLATRDVAEWPEGQRRVAAARRFVLARLRGRRPRRVPFEDVLFTAGLLARIFESELRLSMSDMVAIFDKIGFPTEAVPLMPRASSRRPQDPTLAPITPLRPDPVAVAFQSVAVDECHECDECGQVGPHLRIAA